MNIDDIALSFHAGLNYATIIYLVEHFGSATAVYGASHSDLVEDAELKPNLAETILKRGYHKLAEQELRFMADNGIQAVASTDPAYPPMLRECNDYPHIIYIKGDMAVLSAPMVSMVGTRKATSYGVSVCNKLVGEMAAITPEVVVVSGLAYGIDAASHRAAVANSTRTIGVLANPLNGIYPSVHRAMAEDMVSRGGALITEMCSRDAPTRPRFIQRNRIIAGISAGTIVVQSPLGGGSMVTASLADGYNRVLMAPPANVGEIMSEGTNALIRRMKARVVCCGGDVLEELGWLPADQIESRTQPSSVPANEMEKRVYGLICSSPGCTLEEIKSKTDMATPLLMETLIELEFGGFIRPMPGNQYEKSLA